MSIETATRTRVTGVAPPRPRAETKVVLSTLWIFAMFNYLYCDLLGLMDSKYLKGYLDGKVGSIRVTQGFLLGSAVLMEVPIAMVLLSRRLNHRANRTANVVAGAFMTVVQAGTLLIGSATVYYVFFSIVEMATTLLIVWRAWKWNEASAPRLDAVGL
jgi:hypothetical protein